MSKAILVMNMPDSCVGCPLCQRGENNCYYCMATFKIIVDVWLKANWCPLREVPKKQTIYCTDTAHHRFAKGGYNYCINEIMKGVEENE